MARGARTEALPRGVLSRLETEISSAIRRKTAAEAKLAGALRALSGPSAAVRAMLVETGAVFARRRAFDRELYAAAIRAAAEQQDKRVVPILKTALASEDAGGLCSLSAACFVTEAALVPLLTKIASGRHSHLAFAAEVARMARGESSGAHLIALAPKIKEAHRIALCVEIFVPLTRGPVLGPHIGPALAILRDSERHLGRWLVLAAVACRAADESPLAEARSKAKEGPASSRAAWALVAWALEPGSIPPAARPTLELVARLSDRPSADRDTSFLFALAVARAPSARPVLETLCKLPITTVVGVRAALYLARDHNRPELLDVLREIADSPRQEELRGIAVAALWDAGQREAAGSRADALCQSPALETMTWASLVLAAREGRLGETAVLSELNFRRIQCGWIE